MGITRSSPILLVDDSPAILALLKDMLKANGFTNVRTATSVEEGLRLFEGEHPRVVFLDLMMPDSSGLEFTKRALEQDPSARIVVTTALPPSHESVVMAVSQGAADYLPKPLRRDALQSVIEHLKREERPNDSASYYG